MAAQKRTPPPDFRLTQAEVDKLIAEQLGRPLVLDDDGMVVGDTHGLLTAMRGFRPVRDRYASWLEEDETQAKTEVRDDPVGIPEQVRRFIESNPRRLFPVQEDAIRWARPVKGVQPNWKHLGLMLCGEQWGKSTAACMTLHPSFVKTAGLRRLYIPESRLIRILSSRAADREVDRLVDLDRIVVDSMGYSTMGGTRGFREVIEFLRIRWEKGRQNVLTSKLVGASAWSKVYGADGWAVLERFCTVLKTEARDGK